MKTKDKVLKALRPKKLKYYSRGDVVHVKNELKYHKARDHFKRNKDAIVLYSYYTLYGGNTHEHKNEYCILFINDGNESSWYYGEDFEFIRKGTEEEIEMIMKKFK